MQQSLQRSYLVWRFYRYPKHLLVKSWFAQKKMMRKIVGWMRLEDEPWEITMRRMKHHVAQTLHQFPVVWWSRRFATYLWKFAARVKTSPLDSLIVQCCEWEPNLIDDAACEYSPYRGVGRPCLWVRERNINI